MSWPYLILPVLQFLLLLRGPLAVPAGGSGSGEAVYGLLLALHLAAGLALCRRKGAFPEGWRFLAFRVPEILFASTLMLFLFSYIYALNANMDYVQRFIATGGAVRLALDTTRERLRAGGRFLPLLALDLFYYLYFRVRRSGLLLGDGKDRPAESRPELAVWALPATAFSALLVTFSFPSFLKLEGLPVLAWFALVPLFLVLDSVSWRQGLFYGAFFGVLQGMLTNFWLGTFSLISLQLVSLYFLFGYLLFLMPALYLVRQVRRGRLRKFSFLVYPLAWTVFDYLRSLGFLGYPWGMLGTSQYGLLPLIQIASVTGVWGVSFLVVLVNSALAWALLRWRPTAARGESAGPSGLYREIGPALFSAAGLFLLALAGGGLYLGVTGRTAAQAEEERTARVALVQQNSDPRKDDYRKTFTTLVQLTDRAVQEGVDLVVWSETAFVPNIRRWSLEDPAVYPLARLVGEFLDYQKGLGTWLLTGNDDYELFRNEDGSEGRRNYNAAVFFGPDGQRVATYHKVHLVPFTEHFPYKDSLPRAYELLQQFDVHLWEPGTERVVFHHPGFSFATPICFEDTFPDDVRRFVRNGAEAIVNISNDFWSLTEVEAKQHYIHSLFRAVENRRPLLRASASGVTGHVDPQGRLQASLPYYTEGYLVVEVPLHQAGWTVYTRFGDWFPRAAGLFLLVLFFIGLRPRTAQPAPPRPLHR